MMSIADRIQRAYELEHRVPSDRLTPRVLHHESLILGSRRDLMKTMELVESDNLTSTQLAQLTYLLGIYQMQHDRYPLRLARSKDLQVDY